MHIIRVRFCVGLCAINVARLLRTFISHIEHLVHYDMID
jgi:hypothetical protein